MKLEIGDIVMIKHNKGVYAGRPQSEGNTIYSDKIGRIVSRKPTRVVGVDTKYEVHIDGYKKNSWWRKENLILMPRKRKLERIFNIYE